MSLDCYGRRRRRRRKGMGRLPMAAIVPIVLSCYAAVFFVAALFLAGMAQVAQ